MAQQRCEGLDVNILLQDYRDLNKHYDRIVSVGMFEHVGPKNYDTYFIPPTRPSHNRYRVNAYPV